MSAVDDAWRYSGQRENVNRDAVFACLFRQLDEIDANESAVAAGLTDSSKVSEAPPPPRCNLDRFFLFESLLKLKCNLSLISNISHSDDREIRAISLSLEKAWRHYNATASQLLPPPASLQPDELLSSAGRFVVFLASTLHQTADMSTIHDTLTRFVEFAQKITQNAVQMFERTMRASSTSEQSVLDVLEGSRVTLLVLRSVVTLVNTIDGNVSENDLETKTVVSSLGRSLRDAVETICTIITGGMVVDEKQGQQPTLIHCPMLAATTPATHRVHQRMRVEILSSVACFWDLITPDARDRIQRHARCVCKETLPEDAVHVDGVGDVRSEADAAGDQKTEIPVLTLVLQVFDGTRQPEFLKWFEIQFQRCWQRTSQQQYAYRVELLRLALAAFRITARRVYLEFASANLTAMLPPPPPWDLSNGNDDALISHARLLIDVLLPSEAKAAEMSISPSAILTVPSSGLPSLMSCRSCVPVVGVTPSGVSRIAPGVVQCQRILSMDSCEQIARKVLSGVSISQLMTAPIRIPQVVPDYQRLLASLVHMVQSVVNGLNDELAEPLWSGSPPDGVILKRPTKMWRGRYWEESQAPPSRHKTLKLMRAYVIRYDKEGHRFIDSHSDAAHVTCNVCLRLTQKSSWYGNSSKKQSRGGLAFEQPELSLYHHVVGDALIHRSDIRHHTHSLEHKGDERIQMVLLFEFEEDDKPLSAAIRARAHSLGFSRMINELPHDVLGEVCRYLSLRDLANVASCGSRILYSILAPSVEVGGQQSNSLWRTRIFDTQRICRWLPMLWPERYGVGKTEYFTYIPPRARQYAFTSDDMTFLCNCRSLWSIWNEARDASGISRECLEQYQKLQATTHKGNEKEDKERTSGASAKRAGSRVAFTEPQKGSFDMVVEDWGDADETIDWYRMVKASCAFARVADVYFRRASIDEDEADPDDNDSDTDTTCATGSSYTSPAVIKELRALAKRYGDDMDAEKCYTCAEAMERVMNRRQAQAVVGNSDH